MLAVTQTNTGAAGTGVSFDYSVNCQLRDVVVTGFLHGVSLRNAPQTNVQRVQCDYAPTTTASAAGFYLDGSPSGATGDTLGNNSSVFRDCVAGFSSPTTPATGFEILSVAANGNCSDLTFDNCTATGGTNGFSFNFSNCKKYSEADSDVELINPISTLYTQNGIVVTGNPDNETSFLVAGGFLAPTTATTTTYGINLQSFRGISIVGTQFFPTDTLPTTGPPYYAAYGVYCGSSTFDVLVSSCQFNGQTYGVFCNGSEGVSISGNRFYSTPAGGVGQAMSPAVTCESSSYVTVVANSFACILATGMPSGIYFESNSSYCVASGNVIDQIIPTKIYNLGTDNLIADNPGYNPLGTGITQPPAPVVSTPYTYTNATGVFMTIYVSGGSFTVGVSIDGRATNLTSGSFRLPPGKAITFTPGLTVPTLEAIGD